MDSQIENFLNSLAASHDQRYGEEYQVYASGSGELFAMVHLGTRPLQIDIRCDWQLSRSLQVQYESIMPARKLNPRQWVTVLDTPQLEDGLVEDLLRQAVVQAEQAADN
jgi:predicted DNA-binding protein (MmcQ/YjbR family)